MQTRKYPGFSLTELLTVLVIMLTLGTIAVTSYSGFKTEGKSRAGTVVLGLTQMEGRRLAKTDGSFPLGLETSLPVLENYAYVSKSVYATFGTVSVFRVSDDTAIYATSGSNGCFVLVDRLVGRSSWLVDYDNVSFCSAELVAPVALSRESSGSSTSPVSVTFNG